MPRAELKRRIDAIESGYEFMLAFAAQGVRDDRDSPTGGQLRKALADMAQALDGLPEALEAIVTDGGLQPADAFRAYAGVLRRDAEATLAAVELVRSREAVSSQLVDNLNASMHLRGLLTDLFLIDEALKDSIK